MDRIIAAIVRFVLTWMAFGAMAVLAYELYPGFTDVTVPFFVAFEVIAFGIAVHAALRGTPRLNRSYKLLVVLFGWSMVRTRMMKWGIFSPFSNIVLYPASWTAFAAFALWSTYVIVYRIRLLDRDGPVGQRVSLG